MSKRRWRVYAEEEKKRIQYYVSFFVHIFIYFLSSIQQVYLFLINQYKNVNISHLQINYISLSNKPFPLCQKPSQLGLFGPCRPLQNELFTHISHSLQWHLKTIMLMLCIKYMLYNVLK